MQPCSTKWSDMTGCFYPSLEGFSSTTNTRRTYAPLSISHSLFSISSLSISPVSPSSFSPLSFFSSSFFPLVIFSQCSGVLAAGTTPCLLWNAVSGFPVFSGPDRSPIERCPREKNLVTSKLSRRIEINNLIRLLYTIV